MGFNTSQLKKVFTRKYSAALLREKELKYLDKKIYRYIDMLSFFQIVGQRMMYVSRKKAFADYYEKGKYIELIYLINRLRPFDDDFLEAYESMWKEREKNIPEVEDVPVSCWSLSGGDDYYRWSSNMKMPITICIGTTVRSLIDAFEETTSIFAGKVIYRGKPAENPDEMALFNKKEAYSCEEEFRFCFPERIEKDNKEIFIKLKSSNWIKSIHIGTLTNRDMALSFFHFLKTIPSIKDIVHLSVLNEKESEEKKKKS